MFWKRRYSAVNTSDVPTQVVTTTASGCVDDPAKGWGRKVSLDQGIPPIIDSFFYQRKSGETTRQPKRNFFTFLIFSRIKCEIKRFEIA